MFKVDATEAAPIVERAMRSLMLSVAEYGRAGSDARRAIGDVLAHLLTLLHDDALGEPLATTFDLARKAGATLQPMIAVYNQVASEAPTTLGGNLIKDTLLMLCFANASRVTADMTFTSRDQVEQVKATLNDAFKGLEDIVADAMDSTAYLSLVSMHAAVARFLTETSRPLPRMLAFRFAAPLSTLQAAHRLYADAGRADELREENDVVHPAFMQPVGRALSA